MTLEEQDIFRKHPISDRQRSDSWRHVGLRISWPSLRWRQLCNPLFTPGRSPPAVGYRRWSVPGLALPGWQRRKVECSNHLWLNHQIAYSEVLMSLQHVGF